MEHATVQTIQFIIILFPNLPGHDTYEHEIHGHDIPDLIHNH